jgi:uncharacterized protein (TIGR01244 family)
MSFALIPFDEKMGRLQMPRLETSEGLGGLRMRGKLERFQIVIAAALPGLSGCGDVPETWETAPVKVEVPGGGATYWEIGNYYVSGQPTAAGLAALRERGVRTVINLRQPSEPAGFDEPKTAETLGLAYVSIPVTSQTLDASKIEEFLAVLHESKKPALIHCASGDRASALWAAHLGTSHGMDADEAIASAETTGLRKSELKAAVRAYLADRAESRARAATPQGTSSR